MHPTFTHGVVLTGGIATGKSSVATLLADAGFEIIDADTIAHTVLNSHILETVALFGNDMVVDGKVDRKRLGNIVFSDQKAKKQLEQLVHPIIHQEIINQATQLENQNRTYFVDIPLFFETRRYPFSRVIVVYAPQTIQLERLIKRNGLSHEEAMRRINAQLPIEEKKKEATYLIDNSGDTKQLSQEVAKVMKEIHHDSHQIFR